MRRWTNWSALVACTLGLALAAPAMAQQTKDQQKCTNAMNKNLEKVTKAQGKDICDCIKNGAKGKTDKLGGSGTVSGCFTADVKGKVQKAKDKTQKDFDKSCTGLDKNGDPKYPSFGVTDVASVNAVGMNKELKLAAAIFGSDIDSAVIPEAQDKDASKCQQAIAKTVKKCQETKIKEFNKCKKDGLKGKTGPAFTSAADLEGCVGADPKGKVAKACDDPGQPDKIRKDIDKKCTGKGVDLSDAFPGCDTDDPAALHACLESAADCTSCAAILGADGIPGWPCTGCDLGTASCTANGDSFCVGGIDDGEPCTDFLGATECSGGNCLGLSTTILYRTKPGPPNAGSTQQLFDITQFSTFEISCDEPGLDGQASCTCDLLESDPIDLGALIGVACLQPAVVPNCGQGKVDCDGGESLDLVVEFDHNIGNCGLLDDPNIKDDPDQLLGPEECEASCDAHCSGKGAGWRLFRSQCEGYCKFGVRDGARCLNDIECLPGGECNGGEPVAHSQTCGCQCIQEDSGAPANPGAVRCEVGLATTVEIEEPCDGVDITLQSLNCVPRTTEEMVQRTLEANNVPGFTILPADELGVTRVCGQWASGHLTDMRFVGNSSSLDGGLGDLNQPTNVLCK